MVQRKLPNKLGIQADNMKAEKRLGSLKPSSCQHLDGKNKATDLTKKMKKSRTIKLSAPSDIEGLRSSPARKTIAQPGKPPPPLNVPAAASPQKKSMMKAMDGSSPNYMKSTSSSEAKKEISPVSSRNIQTGSDSKYLRRRSSTGSKISSGGSCNKPARTLTKTSSLKLVRTLTKSPSFKPARASAKKCSRGVALCADMDAQRATCSSTLKDSKFPAYLMLNPGGTESEGTSVIKVCPYTYCSLNGHHHTPLPPLKCFLKARRRSLKTQRSMKMEALSPRRLKPSSGDGTEELKAEPVVFGSNGVDLDDAPMSPLMQETSMDFFIEIYAKGKGNDAEADGGSAEMKNEGMDGTEQEHDAEKPVSESFSEGSPRSEIDFDENLDHCSEIISKVESRETHHGDLKDNDADEDFRGIMVKEESSPWDFHDGDDQEYPSSIVVDHAMFEVIDMEWEEWRFSASEPDDETHSSAETDDQSNLIIGDSSESDGNSLHTGESEEILADGAEQEVSEEEIACIDTESQVSETISYDQISLAEDMFQIFVAMEDEEDRNTEIDFTPSSTEELHEGERSGQEKILEDGISSTINEVSEVDPPQEVPEISCIIDVKDEYLESTEQFQLQSSDVLEQDKTNEEQTDSIGDFSLEDLPNGEAGDGMEARAVEDSYEVDDNQKNQVFEVNSDVDESLTTQAIVDESLVSESQDLQSDSQHHENPNVADNQSIQEEDQGEAKSKVPTCMDLEENNCSMMLKTSLAEGSEKIGEMELEDSTSAGLDVAEMFPEEGDSTRHECRSRYTRSNAKDELPGDQNNRKWTICRKKHEESYEEARQFNPREPNFLPVVPEPDAEKVDLRHQMMDDRKNAEDWMLDHALQQAVSKLAPARKRKVALLVEAFETVLPVPINKYETRLRHTSTGFVHGRPVQACN
ncbi:hypothetical protein COLO4_25831 [Corchorus olitorius]|uniref:Calmodulin-binding domain-containing protein n=1 Tax=Corchorus olitorius TaxID=93759 RepID=A0A1R3HZX1_9ROSI|nr:hypothetical protein COLO4_25831 [Corchorus olitorius]